MFELNIFHILANIIIILFILNLLFVLQIGNHGISGYIWVHSIFATMYTVNETQPVRGHIDYRLDARIIV